MGLLEDVKEFVISLKYEVHEGDGIEFFETCLTDYCEEMMGYHWANAPHGKDVLDNWLGLQNSENVRRCMRYLYELHLHKGGKPLTPPSN